MLVIIGFSLCSLQFAISMKSGAYVFLTTSELVPITLGYQYIFIGQYTQLKYYSFLTISHK